MGKCQSVFCEKMKSEPSLAKVFGIFFSILFIGWLEFLKTLIVINCLMFAIARQNFYQQEFACVRCDV